MPLVAVTIGGAGRFHTGPHFVALATVIRGVGEKRKRERERERERERDAARTSNGMVNGVLIAPKNSRKRFYEN
jgi:hypothetical protein